MEMFNTHRRDLLGFEDYMDLKKPGFGGPASAISARDAKGKLVDKNPKLAQHRRVVERDPAFSHKVYDSTYKAMTHDLVYKQEGKKPFTYPDPYLTAYPTVQLGEIDESTNLVSFQSFINEDYDSISDVEANLKSYEGEREEEYGMNPSYSDYSVCCDAPIDETGCCSECGEDCNETEDEDYGIGPELTDDPSNPLGLSKEEMDNFLKDLNN